MENENKTKSRLLLEEAIEKLDAEEMRDAGESFVGGYRTERDLSLSMTGNSDDVYAALMMTVEGYMKMTVEKYGYNPERVYLLVKAGVQEALRHFAEAHAIDTSYDSDFPELARQLGVIEDNDEKETEI